MDAKSIAGFLSTAFLGGDLEVAGLVARGSRALGRRWRWLSPLARRIVGEFAGRTSPTRADLVRFLLDDDGFKRVRLKYSTRIKVVQSVFEATGMRSSWGVPEIDNPLALADWLCLSPGELDWFADLKHYLKAPRVAGSLRHYHYRVLGKGSGGIRLIEAPKSNLKAIQRKILSDILDLVPTHEAAHGFRKARSIRSFVGPHAGKRVVLKMDLQDFFPSIGRARIQALFRTIGYPYAVADLLGGLCTTVTPHEVLPSAESRELYSRTHLPQGAPTSPALANLCAYRVDCRLTGLAKVAGAEYTRYADDLAFSGGEDFDQRVERFSLHAVAILKEEGFEVCHRKTRIMRQGVRQQLAGLVTNDHPNIRRSDFDQLKAILTNCVRQAPATQNREGHADFRAHLSGRVGFVEFISPARGAKLRAIFDQIDWGAS